MAARFSSLWRHSDFLKLWTGQTISAFGSMVGRAALSFAAILVLGATPVEMSLLRTAELLPAILTALVAGVWIDRQRRRPLLMAADLGRAALLATIPLAALLGVLRLEQLYVVAFLVGLLTLVFDVAYQTYLPSLIRREHLVEGNSKLTASSAVAETAGFGVAGWLVQLLTAPVALLVDALSFVASFVSIAAIRAPEPPAPAPAERSPLVAEAVDGLRAVLRSPILRAIAGSTLIVELAFSLYGTNVVLFMVRDLGFRPGVLGMIFAVGGVSSFLGSVLASRAARRLGVGPAMAAGMLGMGLSMFFVPLAQGTSVLAAALLIAQQLVGDGAYTVYDVTQVSLRQVVADDRVLGRVNATTRLGGLAATLLGTLLAGGLGQAIGLRPTLVLGATLAVVAATGLALSPVGAVREIAAASPSDATRP